jgi:MFS superfamily sulfate permease-like transporter
MTDEKELEVDLSRLSVVVVVVVVVVACFNVFISFQTVYCHAMRFFLLRCAKTRSENLIFEEEEFRSRANVLNATRRRERGSDILETESCCVG